MSVYEPCNSEERKGTDVCAGLSLAGIKPVYENKKSYYLQKL